MGEIWGRNGRETAVAEWRWAQLVQTRPFRFGTGSWNSFFQYETVPLHADGDANFPFFYSQSAFGSFAQ